MYQPLKQTDHRFFSFQSHDNTMNDSIMKDGYMRSRDYLSVPVENLRIDVVLKPNLEEDRQGVLTVLCRLSSDEALVELIWKRRVGRTFPTILNRLEPKNSLSVSGRFEIRLYEENGQLKFKRSITATKLNDFCSSSKIEDGCTLPILSSKEAGKESDFFTNLKYLRAKIEYEKCIEKLEKMSVSLPGSTLVSARGSAPGSVSVSARGFTPRSALGSASGSASGSALRSAPGKLTDPHKWYITTTVTSKGKCKRIRCKYPVQTPKQGILILVLLFILIYCLPINIHCGILLLFDTLGLLLYLLLSGTFVAYLLNPLEQCRNRRKKERYKVRSRINSDIFAGREIIT